MTDNKNQYGGPQMVKIDGALVRQFREQKGLTQLYVATVVDVTTDTISRWENRRYPSIKQENAEKLAEALQVSLEKILDQPDENPPAENTVDSLPETDAAERSGFNQWYAYAITLVAVLFVAIFLVIYKTPDTVIATITAERILPPHVPAGQTFPVVIKVSGSSQDPLSIVLRETVPYGSRVNSSAPPVSTISKDQRLVKWITRFHKEKVFAYIARNPYTSSEGSEIVFSGQVLSGPGSGKTIAIAGDNSIKTRNFHWADINMDFSIDDEEILAVYDLFSEISGLEFRGDKLDELWAAERYSYDTINDRYEVDQ